MGSGKEAVAIGKVSHGGTPSRDSRYNPAIMPAATIEAIVFSSGAAR
ncbi:MAG: hypothetical protein HY778_09815 [Betaproteobacteria bacterium]|nr:hypothetical protein [Betaproteobacteria bacterium]